MMLLVNDNTSGMGAVSEAVKPPRVRLEESVEEMRQRAVEDLQAFLDGALNETNPKAAANG